MVRLQTQNAIAFLLQLKLRGILQESQTRGVLEALGIMTDIRTKLPAPKGPTTEAFLAGAGPALADLCTACGACFEACPMADHIGLRETDPHSITDGLRRLARGEAAPAETISWVSACAKSGLCVAACPQQSAGLNAMLLVRIAKQHAINETRQISVKPDPTLFPRVKTYAQLQLTDEELDAWL